MLGVVDRGQGRWVSVSCNNASCNCDLKAYSGNIANKS